MNLKRLWKRREMREAMAPGEFMSIYRETIDPLYRYVSRRTGGDRGLAEDCVQEAFLRALSDWTAHGRPAASLAWLKTVCRNLLASHFRRTQPASLDALHWEPQDSVSQDPEQAILVHWGLGRLDRSQAELLEEFHFDGRGVREMAHRRGLSERAVEGRLRRARQALKRILKPLLQSQRSQDL